uniref:Reelin domain-containing protein n=1 Tax=Labrus bergylta TaxID=56723 RepID=A0A3Q3NM29_9LABR
MSPAGFSCLLFIAVLVCHWVPAGCYANGKVAKACHGMEPSHHARGQFSPSPYILTVNATTYGPGDQILVVLSGSTYFTGFLLQARDTPSQGSASIVGTFTLMDPKRTQLLTCNKLKVNMHIDTKVQSVVILSNITMLVFLWFSSVTVVQEFKVFWVKLPGPIINEEGFTSNPTQPGTRTTPPSLQTTTTSILPEPMTSQGCGQSKSCLLDPPGCNPKEDPLCFFLSMTTEGPKSVMFELSGPADGYVAFALSLDTWMVSKSHKVLKQSVQSLKL